MELIEAVYVHCVSFSTKLRQTDSDVIWDESGVVYVSVVLFIRQLRQDCCILFQALHMSVPQMC